MTERDARGAVSSIMAVIWGRCRKERCRCFCKKECVSLGEEGYEYITGGLGLERTNSCFARDVLCALAKRECVFWAPDCGVVRNDTCTRILSGGSGIWNREIDSRAEAIMVFVVVVFCAVWGLVWSVP